MFIFGYYRSNFEKEGFGSSCSDLDSYFLEIWCKERGEGKYRISHMSFEHSAPSPKEWCTSKQTPLSDLRQPTFVCRGCVNKATAGCACKLHMSYMDIWVLWLPYYTLVSSFTKHWLGTTYVLLTTVLKFLMFWKELQRNTQYRELKLCQAIAFTWFGKVLICIRTKC